MIVRRVERINDAIHNWMLQLVEVNVGHFYRQSATFGGWQREAKRDELIQPGMQYLQAEDTQPRGFISYLVCEEESALDEGLRKVIYIYEVQVEREFRGKGIGSMLMETLFCEVMKDAALPREVMLTCFKKNSKAIQFYQRHGFVEDEISPSKCKIKADYLIMSKKL